MAGAERKARIGFIGAGWWATANHMPAFAARDDVEMAAVCRLGADELQQVRQQFGFEYATEDYRELLDNVELDGVVVASPHTLHYEHALAALERGLHVMCEKPLTTSGAHARRLVEVAAEQGVEIVIPYGWHYKPYVQEARNRLNAGAVWDHRVRDVPHGVACAGSAGRRSVRRLGRRHDGPAVRAC